MSELRTITAVVEIPEGSELRYPGLAVERASVALETAGFAIVRLRNAHNETGDLPAVSEVSA